MVRLTDVNTGKLWIKVQVYRFKLAAVMVRGGTREFVYDLNGSGFLKKGAGGIFTSFEPESGLLESGRKKVHLQVGLGRGYLWAHGSSLDLEVMLGVKGKVVVGGGELGELDKELIG